MMSAAEIARVEAEPLCAAWKDLALVQRAMLLHVRRGVRVPAELVARETAALARVWQLGGVVK